MLNFVPNQAQFQQLTVFEVDSKNTPGTTLSFALINQHGHLQLSCIKLNSPPNLHFSFTQNRDKIQSFWSKTYRSDIELPRKMFQMRSISKTFDYLNDPMQRVIELEQKMMNGKRNLLFKIYVPVTKNISDFVALELYALSNDQITWNIQLRRGLCEAIQEKIRDIVIMRASRKYQQEQYQRLQSLNAEKYVDDSQQGEILEQYQSKQPQYQGSSLKQHHKNRKFVKDNVELIELEMPYSKSDQQPHTNLIPMQGIWGQNIQTQENQQSWNSQAQFSNDSVNYTNQAESSLLAKEHIVLLESKNQFLLDRVLSLQLQLIKKNMQLQVYQQQGYGERNGVDKLLEKKCYNRMKKYLGAINQLIVLFVQLKQKTQLSLNMNRQFIKRGNDGEERKVEQSSIQLDPQSEFIQRVLYGSSLLSQSQQPQQGEINYNNNSATLNNHHKDVPSNNYQPSQAINEVIQKMERVLDRIQ